ncbi:MAG: glycosyltransferase [Terrimicrobiaceae bacterium]
MIFSIITPTYNQLDWLRLCIASVRDQATGFSGLQVEHIVQDAGSEGIGEFARGVGAEFNHNDHQILPPNRSDSVPEIIDRRPYSLKIFSGKDGGMYDAINRGLRRSSGQICAWLNSDEQYLPQTLATVGDFFSSHPRAEMVLGDTIILNESLTPCSLRPGVPPIRQYIQAFNLNIHSSSLFFRRSLLDRGILLGERFRSIGDSEWIARLLDAGVVIHTVPKTLSTFVLGKRNLSGAVLSSEEKAVWAKELPLSTSERALLKARHVFRRFTRGAYRPRYQGVELFTLGDPERRTAVPPRWLDFRFRV